MPNEWKVGRIVPVHKGGSILDIENYRPVCVLPNFSKVFERILYEQMLDHLTKNKLFYHRQHGFRRGHSSATCITELNNYVASSLDKNLSVAAVFIDLSKAFDIISHDLLLHKLHHQFKFSNSSLLLLKSYLSNRTQFVNVCNANLSLIHI